MYNRQLRSLPPIILLALFWLSIVSGHVMDQKHPELTQN
jgi:hypothetical protein